MSAPVPRAQWPEALRAAAERCPRELSGEECYRRLASIGLEFGPAFRGLSRLCVGSREAVGELSVPSAGSGPYRVPPHALDAALHSLAVLATVEVEKPGQGFLLAAVRSIRVKGALGERGSCHAALEAGGEEGTFRGSVRVYGPTGALAVEVDGLVLRPAALGQAAWARERVYKVAWEKREPGAPAPSAPRARPWLWIEADAAAAGALAAHLKAQGQPDLVVAWPPGGPPRAVPASAPEPVPAWEALLDGANVERAVWLTRALDAEGVAAECERVLELVRGAVRAGRAAPRLAVATFGAQAASPEPPQAALWGLMRVMAREHPDRWGGLVDLPVGARADAERITSAVAAALGQGGAQAAMRDGALLEPRLRREPLPPPGASGPIRPDATYLVTGGLGGVGLALAGWLVDRGAAYLVLMGRRAPSPQAAEAVAVLERRGARVQVVQGDAAVAPDVERALAAPAAQGWPAVKGVFHLAAALADGVMERLDGARLRVPLAPKVSGGWNLHRATLGMPLDHFVLFSSIAALGTPGQAGYAAANAFLDALAQRRRADGLPGLSLGFGAIAEVGGLAELEARGGRGAPGVESMPPFRALDAMGALLSSSSAHALIASVAWSAFADGLPPGAAGIYAPLLERDRAGAGSASAPAASGELDFAAQVRSLPARARRDALEAHLKQQITRILGLALSQAPAPDQPLMQAGLDSLMTVQLRNALRASLQLDLPVTLLFDYTTIAALANHLASELAAGGSPANESPATAAATAAGQSDQGDALDAVLSALEQMPEDEAVARLREDKPKA